MNELLDLSREERKALCREVMEKLSDLIEGEAPEEFCERVDDVFAECQPFRAYRDTLAATIELARECGGRTPASMGVDDAAFLRCVERVRSRLSDNRSEDPKGEEQE